jgi:dolichol kinase
MSDLRILTLDTARTLKTEILRKSIHFLIALSPGMAALSRPLTMGFLGVGVVFYTIAEILRCSGVKVPLVSFLTVAASRPRDERHFVMGPITLGLGAFLAILAFPPLAASIAIYSLAFGDGFASLIGKSFGRIRPAFMFEKSIEGSFACFIAVFLTALKVSGNTPLALSAAVVATVTEALPLEDYDNLALPLAVGFVVAAFF